MPDKNLDKETLITTARQVVSGLIKDVLCGKTFVREALLRFPAGLEDDSLTAAWHALCHYEADESLRLRDFQYKEEQDEYLMLISEIFETGKELPENIIASYNLYYEDAPIPCKTGFAGFVERFKRFLNV